MSSSSRRTVLGSLGATAIAGLTGNSASSISAETTSEAENVAAAAEEQTTSLSEVTRSAGRRSEKASGLQAALDRIETSESATASDDLFESLRRSGEPPDGDDSDGGGPETLALTNDESGFFGDGSTGDETRSRDEADSMMGPPNARDD